MIYTSYFARIKEVPNPISIALFKPKWLQNVREYEKIMPPIWLLNSYKKGATSAECYEATFRRVVLDKLDPAQVVAELTPLGSVQDFTLLCYEKSGDFCHRHVVSKWFRENGIPCEEFEFGQQTLF